MSERHLLLLLKDMLESIRLIETYVNGMDFDAFLADRMRYSPFVGQLLGFC